MVTVMTMMMMMVALIRAIKLQMKTTQKMLMVRSMTVAALCVVSVAASVADAGEDAGNMMMTTMVINSIVDGDGDDDSAVFGLVTMMMGMSIHLQTQPYLGRIQSKDLLGHHTDNKSMSSYLPRMLVTEGTTLA